MGLKNFLPLRGKKFYFVLVFRKFWAIYAVLLFLVMMTISVPVLLFNMTVFPGQRALRKNIQYLHHVFTPTFLFLVGIRLKVVGMEQLKSNQSYVIIGNHRSALDFIVNAAAFPGIYRYLAKQELLRVPVFGWVVKKMCLIVDRKDAMSRARSILNLKQQLQEGWSVFIYPEGSRNKTSEPLAPFYDGAFRLAIETGAPLAIQTLVNIQNISGPKGFSGLQPGKLEIIWDEPIETTQLQLDQVRSLKEMAAARMRAHLNKKET